MNVIATGSFAVHDIFFAILAEVFEADGTWVVQGFAVSWWGVLVESRVFRADHCSPSFSLSLPVSLGRGGALAKMFFSSEDSRAS